MNDYINKKAAYKVLTLYTASFVCLFILYRKSTTDQDNNQQSQNCIQFGEYGHHHSSTEHIVAGSNACDTICTNLCLTDRRAPKIAVAFNIVMLSTKNFCIMK